MKAILRLVLMGVILICCGCSYYRVTDPTTEKVYYTTEIRKAGSGAITLTDVRTEKKITLQNSEIEKISEDEYKKSIYSE